MPRPVRPTSHSSAAAPLHAQTSISDPYNLLAGTSAPSDLATTVATRRVDDGDTSGPQRAPVTGGIDPALLPAWWYHLLLRAHQLRGAATFDTLLAPAALSTAFQPHPYQLRVVERVLREMAPAAILADDVGLGKTLEAGLIYKELALRGTVATTLILAPKSLLGQWQEELAEYFNEDFVLTDEKRFRGWDEEPRIICSLPQFTRSFASINKRTWDMLIVDEAHLLANPTSKRRGAVREVRARWRLLLTATPLANKLTDLYSLIDIVAPGRLGTQREFEQAYVADPSTCRTLRPEAAPRLRAIVRDVTCRTRRAETEIPFAGRSVQTYAVAPSDAEDALITDVTDYLRSMYRRAPAHRANRGAVIREIMALQQSLSSSPRAIERSLRNRAERSAENEADRALLLALAARCEEVTSAKEEMLLNMLRELGSEPVLIFTLRLETAARLREVLRAAGRSADCYVGALSRIERQAMVERFNRGDLQTLVATDAGAEGLNLHERCSVVLNYDLNWNPMKIEQRIGRVHRLGQTHDVRVATFVLRDTIDDYVLRLLYQKLNLFTLTIGAMETILAEMQEGEVDLEERILELLLQAPDRGTLARDVEALGDDLIEARTRQHAAQSLTEEVLG